MDYSEQISEESLSHPDWLINNIIEKRCHHRTYAYFSQIAWRVEAIPWAEVSELLFTAIEQGKLTDDEAADISMSGVLARGLQDGVPVYLVVQVSWATTMDAVKRAVRRANLLKQVGISTIPVVIGKEATPEVTVEAERDQVWLITNENDRVIPGWWLSN